MCGVCNTKKLYFISETAGNKALRNNVNEIFKNYNKDAVHNSVFKFHVTNWASGYGLD
jgi:hypothetical protein